MKKFIKLLIFFLFYSLFFQVIVVSFSERIFWPDFIPTGLTFRAWFEALNDQTLITAITNSLKLAILTVLISIILSWPYATTSYHLQIKHKNLARFLEILAYLPIAIPMLIPAFGLYEVLAVYHFTGSIFIISFILAIFLFPYMYRSISNEINLSGYLLEEQAGTLGASKMMIFIKITIPKMVKPISVGSIFVFSGAFNDYLLTYLLGDGEIETLPLVIYPLMTSDDFTLSSAYTIVFILPFVFLSFILKQSGKL